ncbi:MAG: trypsin-like peptidase domain-containing protein, partial [Rubripirellula sp.]
MIFRSNRESRFYGSVWTFAILALALALQQPQATAFQRPDASDGDAKASESDGSDSEVQAGPRALSRAFRNAARKATPSVVTILSYGQNNATQNRNPRTNQNEDDEQASDQEPDENQLTGLGSGVIVTKDGMIITNNHVIAGAKRVMVQMPDETEVEATAVRGDPDSDVATLRISR